MTDRRVFGMVARLDRAHDDVARVDPDADLDEWQSLALKLIGVLPKLLLHRQRRVQSALRMVLMCYGCAEEREDSVASRLRYVAVVTMHGPHHHVQHWIYDRSRLFR